ncbi:MAG TPA: MFS transporter [Stellaceae bacterium]|nr:MFS transporter [Stellaceae bacterium]
MTESVITASPGALARPVGSVETRQSWIAACVTLGLLSISYGSPLLVVVGMKPITADLETSRQLVALAGSATWVGTGLGGILMGQVAERFGARPTAMFGAAMIAVGLVVSTSGGVGMLLLGHAVFVGFLGNGALYPPLVVYVTRWFDRRRGTALALISSGQYVAGMLWPTVFEHAIAGYGWRPTMLVFAAFMVVTVTVIAWFLTQPPAGPSLTTTGATTRRRAVLGMRPNTVQGLLCIASFCCCIPMAIPPAHLVAFCSDIGIPAVQGAAMLSVLQASAFVSRVFWGWLADRVGGLWTVLAASACQALAIAAFTATQDEAGLFAIAAAYGLGFSGIIPAYIVAIREYFPSSEASWRVPTLFFIGMSGMATGSWVAGAIYDSVGFYAPAFALGALFNLVNLALVGFLVLRQRAYGNLRAALA